MFSSQECRRSAGQPVKDPLMSYVIVCVKKKIPLDFSSFDILSRFIISSVFSVGLTGHYQKYLKPYGQFMV